MHRVWPAGELKKKTTHFCLWLSLLEIQNINLEGSDPAKVARLDLLIRPAMFLPVNRHMIGLQRMMGVFTFFHGVP